MWKDLLDACTKLLKVQNRWSEGNLQYEVQLGRKPHLIPIESFNWEI